MPIKRPLTIAERQKRIETGAGKRQKREEQRRKAEQDIAAICEKKRVLKVLKLRNGRTVTQADHLFWRRSSAELAGFRQNRFVKRGQSKAVRHAIELNWKKTGKKKGA